ncbi:restriction endonuclease subunit S [Corynebacterium dentalis]|uniref:restriction endonuclease subunit S n=1 Tax=Corynebacterium dentalis TaxID=2014528 RepID=UPI0028A279BA|nr:restriction endonuclease subunit S [Corynebacterium dentalis]
MTNPQWRNVRLGDIGQSLIGLTYSPSNVKRSGTLVLRSSNIQDGELAFDDNVYVDCAIPEKIRTRENDILICVRNGSRRLIGKSAILDRRVSGQTFGAFMAVYRSDLNPFLRYFFQSDDFKRQIDEHLGATINQITNGSLNGFVVTLPSKSEQQAITERLQDVDRLIATLKRLISKKHAIKQGMMQQLLSGVTRLDGFTGSWDETRLGTVLKFQVGYPFQSSGFSKSTSGMRLVRNRDLRSNDSVIFFSGVFSEDFVLADGDILVGMDGDFEPIIWRGGPALLNQRVGRLILSRHVNGAYLSYALEKPLLEMQNSTGATTVKHLSHRDVEDLSIPLPRVEEQEAIAQILQDADQEIAALERRLESARSINQGMMQELLTGRTRLPIEGVSS